MSEIDRRRYTEPQLKELGRAGALPGFLSEGTYGEELFENTAWQPVHNAAIVNLAEGWPREKGAKLSIVTAIRRREANPTHPDVVSTPTNRMTSERAQELIAMRSAYTIERDPAHYPVIDTFKLDKVDPSRPKTIVEFTPNLQKLEHSDAMAGVANELLYGKLGFDKLTRNEQFLWRYYGTVSLSKVIAGFSYVGDEEMTGEPQYEPIVMFGSVIASREHQLAVPDETFDYRSITRSPLGSFAANVVERNVGGLVIASPEDEVNVCVRGLCLATSVATTLESLDVWEHMGFIESDYGKRHWDPRQLAAAY